MLPTVAPNSLARRFAFAAAGLAVGAVLVVALASWWLINRQQDQALQELATKERQFRAAAVGSDLQALAGRMSEVAASTILATGLVDSAGRETYLAPFLGGIRQINGVPVQLLFTDFEGKEIASNAASLFSAKELAWLRQQLDSGVRGATIQHLPEGVALLALEPLVYSRTASPEGGLLYKVMLADLHVGEPMRLEWGPETPGAERFGPAVAVPAPPVFSQLDFRVRSPARGNAANTPAVTAQYFPIFVIALGLFTAVVVGGVRLAHLLTRDVQKLEAFSSRFLGSGLSTERASVQGSAEVASLARSINKMLDRLNEQHSALLQEREKLADLAEALKLADQRKDEFLATLAHELRNPLAPIRSSVEILKLKITQEGEVAWARDVIDRQVNHMARLLDDLLDVSRITRNKLDLRKEYCSLAGIIEVAIETSRPLLEAGQHRLRVEHPAEPVVVLADSLRLAQVFANLLNNAAKYTPAGGEITLAVTASESQVLVSIKDNGIGIPPEQLPHVFEMFMQTASSHAHAQGGLGIGLSLVRGLVDMHGGSVLARSAGKGQGSEFLVSLPRAREAARDCSTESRAARGSSKRILVADDNRDAAESLAMMLELEGHEVRTAHGGQDALNIAARFQPQIAILDIGMPDMDGYQAARHMRAQAWGKDIVMIALTGWGQAQDKERAREAGFNHHLVKPADPPALNKLLADVA